jgi:hypothetical protein
MLLEVVYWEAERAGAEDVSQFPSSGIEPETLMVCPTSVVTTSLNVTATLDAAVQAELVVDTPELVVELLVVPPAVEVPVEIVVEDPIEDVAEPTGAVEEPLLDIAMSAQVR